MDVNMFDDDKEEKKYEKDLKILRIDASKGKKSLNTAVAEVSSLFSYFKNRIL